jgi:hypothetical protein
MKSLTQSVALVLALGSFAAAASDIVYKAPTELSVLRTELKYSKNGSAWINLTLEDANTPEGGVPYQTVKQIAVPGLSYDANKGEVLYKGIICSNKKFLGTAKVNANCSLTAKIVNKVAYVKDTEGNEHALSSASFVEVRFGSK